MKVSHECSPFYILHIKEMHGWWHRWSMLIILEIHGDCTSHPTKLLFNFWRLDIHSSNIFCVSLLALYVLTQYILGRFFFWNFFWFFFLFGVCREFYRSSLVAQGFPTDFIVNSSNSPDFFFDWFSYINVSWSFWMRQYEDGGVFWYSSSVNTQYWCLSCETFGFQIVILRCDVLWPIKARKNK